jgi:hypothetical protein
MLGRCRCKQLLTGLGRQLEMVCLLRLGSRKGLNPLVKGIKCEQILKPVN